MADNDIIERIGLNITIIRERRGLTQEKLAELAGLLRADIGQIERGRKKKRTEKPRKNRKRLECFHIHSRRKF